MVVKLTIGAPDEYLAAVIKDGGTEDGRDEVGTRKLGGVIAEPSLEHRLPNQGGHRQYQTEPECRTEHGHRVARMPVLSCMHPQPVARHILVGGAQQVMS